MGKKLGACYLNDEQTRASVYDRSRKSIGAKLNPIWWFHNDDEQNLDGASWYHPQWPRWRRELFWQFRNPLQNLRAYVLGCGDKNYFVTGRAPVLAVQRDDLIPPESGWQYCRLSGGDLWLPRYFVSYSGSRVLFYLGWQPSGFFGTKLVFHR